MLPPRYLSRLSSQHLIPPENGAPITFQFVSLPVFDTNRQVSSHSRNLLRFGRRHRHPLVLHLFFYDIRQKEDGPPPLNTRNLGKRGQTRLDRPSTEKTNRWNTPAKNENSSTRQPAQFAPARFLVRMVLHDFSLPFWRGFVSLDAHAT